MRDQIEMKGTRSTIAIIDAQSTGRQLAQRRLISKRIIPFRLRVVSDLKIVIIEFAQLSGNSKQL